MRRAACALEARCICPYARSERFRYLQGSVCVSRRRVLYLRDFLLSVSRARSGRNLDGASLNSGILLSAGGHARTSKTRPVPCGASPLTDQCDSDSITRAVSRVRFRLFDQFHRVWPHGFRANIRFRLSKRQMRQGSRAHRQPSIRIPLVVLRWKPNAQANQLLSTFEACDHSCGIPKKRISQAHLNAFPVMFVVHSSRMSKLKG